MSYLILAIILMGVAVIAVPLAKKLGLGSVIGYLAGGVLIGPSVLGLVSDVDSILQFAELGIIFLLFLIGLELQPKRLWIMRHAILSLGLSQFALTMAVMSGLAYAWGLSLTASLLIGGIMALSSTAFGLQVLSERGEITTRSGRAAFAILLFQDLAALPLLAVLAFLGQDTVSATAGLPWGDILIAGLTVIGVGYAGPHVLRPIYQVIAATGMRELFVALALLTIFGTALLLEAIGLSMALGAFIAGVILADSEYRHELEAHIDPFKGLLLGLFFMAVGMSADFGVILREPLLVFDILIVVLILKIGILYLVGRRGGLSPDGASRMAVAISPAGEFAFVAVTSALASGIIERSIADLVIITVTLSMAATPLMLVARDKLAARLTPDGQPTEYESPKEENEIVIAGFGRYGQIIGRLLWARHIPYTAIESNAEQVTFIRKFGVPIYFGDMSRLDLLQSAKLEHAKFFILALDDVEKSIKTAALVREHFPHITIFARARNRNHVYRLMDLGITHITRETYHSSLTTAKDLLTTLGLSDYDAGRLITLFRDSDEGQLRVQHALQDDEEALMRTTREWAVELEELFQAEASKKAE